MGNVFKSINWKIMIPVMFFTVFQAGFQSFSTVLAEIAAVFPDAPPTLIQTIMTIPSLMSIPISLLAGILASYITKKDLVLCALVCEFAGGIIPIFVNGSIYALIVSSALIGVGQGCLITIASAILAEHFDGVTRATAMGLRQAASSIGQAGLTIMTGYLCLSAWYHAYYVYFLILPIIVLVVLFLPRGGLDIRLVGRGVGTSGLKKVFTPGLIYTCILFFFLGVFNFAFYTNIAMSITSKELGDTSAIGMATAWNSVTTVVIGLLIGYILRIFKKFTLASAFVFVAAAYFVLASAQSLTTITVGGIIFGFGAGIQLPCSIYYVTETVDKMASSLAISVSMAMVSLGVTMSPIIVNQIAGAFGSIDGTTGLYAAGAAYCIMFFIEGGRELWFNKNSTIGIEEV